MIVTVVSQWLCEIRELGTRDRKEINELEDAEGVGKRKAMNHHISPRLAQRHSARPFHRRLHASTIIRSEPVKLPKPIPYPYSISPHSIMIGCFAPRSPNTLCCMDGAVCCVTLKNPEDRQQQECAMKLLIGHVGEPLAGKETVSKIIAERAKHDGLSVGWIQFRDPLQETLQLLDILKACPEPGIRKLWACG